MQIESVHVSYLIPLSRALAELGLPEGDEYDIAISRQDDQLVLQISVTRVPEPDQQIADVVAGLGITPT
jgi:hypothetical protein